MEISVWHNCSCYMLTHNEETASSQKRKSPHADLIIHILDWLLQKIDPEEAMDILASWQEAHDQLWETCFSLIIKMEMFC